MLEFFAMGGYAFYVWCSYGVVLTVLVAMYVAPSWRRRKLFSEINRARVDRHRQ